MKNSIILLMGILWTLCSCSEVEVTDYSPDNFIQFEKAAKDSGQKYDSKTGETTTTLFKGKVSRLGHKMTVTSVNKDVDIDGLNVKKGQELKVTKKDKKVTLSGDGKSKDITFSTKNDTKDKF